MSLAVIIIFSLGVLGDVVYIPHLFTPIFCIFQKTISFEPYFPHIVLHKILKIFTDDSKGY